MAEDAGDEAARSPAEGIFVSLGDEGWQTFRVAVGEVLEFFVNKSDGGMDFPIRCAVIVTEVKDNNGQIGYFGRFIGSEDAGTNRELGNTINHRDRGVHFCQGGPCDALEGTWAAHMSRGRWWSMKNFPREYLKVWGLSVLEEGIRIGYPEEGVKPPEKPRSRGDPAKKKPPAPEKERARRPVARRKKPAVEPAATSGRKSPAGKDPAREALRVKLNTLKERLIGDRREATEDVIEVEESEDGADLSEDSGFAVEKNRRKSALGTGSNLNPNESRLALRDLDDLEDSKGNTLKRPFRVKKEKKEKKALVVKKSRSKRSSLLAMAEQREEEMRKRKVSLQKRKGRSRSSGAKALVQLLSGKRKKGKAKDGGSSPSSSGSSMDGDTEDEESSSESEVTAPLKKRSLKHPGSILKMLVSHATEALDQSAVVEMDSTASVTGGMKMATYFNLLVRPNFNQGSRDLKEMHLLAICIDQLRSGQLKPLADSLSARFVALHCAAVEGSWAAAKHLELHPLEPVQSAPTEVLLRARKHAKLIQRSQGGDEGFNRSKGGGSWSSWKGGGDWRDGGKGRGKGGKGKGGAKGKGKGNGWKQSDWNDWNEKNRDWWKNQKDSKDSKAEKEKESKNG